MDWKDVSLLIEIRGIGISGQKCSGIAYIYKKNAMEYQVVGETDPIIEKQKLIDIRTKSKLDIVGLHQRALEDNVDTAEIFMTHELLIDDVELIKYITDLLDQGYDLLSALIRTKEDMKIHFLNMQSEIFRSKVCDIDDVFDLLIQMETGYTEEQKFPTKPFILICDDIIPSLLYRMPLDNLKGIITRFGSNCSHGAILAKAKNIPVIIRLKNRIDSINNNNQIIMNGESGAIFILDN